MKKLDHKPSTWLSIALTTGWIPRHGTLMRKIARQTKRLTDKDITEIQRKLLEYIVSYDESHRKVDL